MEEDLIIKTGLRTPSFVTSPSNYSQSEIITMQQDAVKRVNEMRQQSMRHINPSNAPVSLDSTEIAESEVSAAATDMFDNAKADEPSPSQNLNIPNSLTGIFDKLDLDSEKIILIGLMLLLMNEGADNTLLMALGYILL